MGYFLTSQPENAVPGKSWVPPKTHTPGSRLEKRGYRFYNPVIGRWASRDRIGERGGIALYGSLANNPIGLVDLLGWLIKSCTFGCHDPGLPPPDDDFTGFWDLLLTSLGGDVRNGRLSGRALEGIKTEMRNNILASLKLPSDCNGTWPAAIPITYDTTSGSVKPTVFGGRGIWAILMDAIDGGYANAWTVGRARVKCSGTATLSKGSSSFCCCRRNVSVSMSCNLKDKFDFVEDPSQPVDSTYNRAARLFEVLYGWRLTSIAVSADWDDKWEDSRCLDWRFIPGL